MDFKVSSFLTEFNPLLPDLNTLTKNRLTLLNCDPKMKIASPKNQSLQLIKRYEFENN